MSVKIMSLVFERFERADQMLLALALADHASDDGSHVYPSVSSLARKCRVSTRTIQRGLRELERIGWLVCESGHSGGNHTGTRYSINASWITGDMCVTGDKLSRVTNEAKNDLTGDTHDATGDIAMSYNPSEPSVREPSNIGQPEVDRFPDFWEKYPRKVKKKPSRQKWKAKRLNRFANGILNDIDARLKSDARWLAGFIPDPTTYLSQERWQDEIQNRSTNV